MTQPSATIAAIATSVGASARAIVRTSGPDALVFARRLATPCTGLAGSEDGQPTAWNASLRLAHEHGDDGLDVPATVLAFFAPRSATGEHVVEYQVPGSPFIIGRLIERLFTLGARQAGPGEFTARAYFNGKLDLAAAEGVAATINAANRVELDAARRLLAGELAARLAMPMARLADTLALVEVGLDFSGEDVSFASRERIGAAIAEVDRALDAIVRASVRFARTAHEPRIVLAGRPNAGKSTLLNALVGEERAVISPTSGTTRDAISAPLRLERGTATLIDVAGLGPTPDASPHDVALQMREQAERSIREADIVVLVIDVTDPRPPIALPRGPHLTVRTKGDQRPHGRRTPVAVSAMTGDGLADLRGELNELAFPTRAVEAGPYLAVNARHLAEIAAARCALSRAGATADASGELVASELRDALGALGRILGNVSPDDVLGRIFASFCIGK